MQDIEKIYEEYFETVNKYLFCLTHNNDISEELTQETNSGDARIENNNRMAEIVLKISTTSGNIRVN